MNFGGTIRLNKFGICIIVGLFFIIVLYSTSTRNNVEKKSMVNLKKLLIASIEAAVKGGKEVVDVYKTSNLNERSKGKTKEGQNEPITNADERSNCAMYYSLKHLFRDVKVISEEVSSESDCRSLHTLDLDETVIKNSKKMEEEEVLASEVTVWIDPLDATKEFTEKLHQYVTTMVCVAVKGVPVIGVIHFPFREEPKTTWAWAHKGISEEIKNKNLSKKLNDSSPVVIVSRSHPGEIENIVKKTFGNSVTVLKAGGSGYKSLEVCAKNATAYIHTTEIKKWDICAGNAIINALGGKMTNLRNEFIDYGSAENTINKDGLLATMENHEKFIDRLKKIYNNI